MDSPAKTAWAASIIGGTIAAAVGGIITFHYSSFFTNLAKIQKPELAIHPAVDTKKLPEPPTPDVRVPETEKKDPPVELQRCGSTIELHFRAIEKIFDPTPRDEEWAALVATLIGCGDFDQAILAAGKMFNPTTRDAAYEQIVNALLQQKQFDAALKVIERIFNPTSRDRLDRRQIAATANK